MEGSTHKCDDHYLEWKDTKTAKERTDLASKIYTRLLTLYGVAYNKNWWEVWVK